MPFLSGELTAKGECEVIRVCFVASDKKFALPAVTGGLIWVEHTTRWGVEAHNVEHIWSWPWQREWWKTRLSDSRIEDIRSRHQHEGCQRHMLLELFRKHKHNTPLYGIGDRQVCTCPVQNPIAWQLATGANSSSHVRTNRRNQSSSRGLEHTVWSSWYNYTQDDSC